MQPLCTLPNVMNLPLFFRASMLLLAAFVGPSAAATQPARAEVQARADNGVEVSNGTARIRVEALTDSILRVRIARGQFPEDSSWAVAQEMRRRAVKVQRLANGFSTKQLNVGVDPKSLALTVATSDGRTIVADAAPAIVGEGAFTLRKEMPVGERYQGLGDKTGPFDRRGASYVNWNTDSYGFGTAADPIYKSIPFYVASGGPGGAYGLFLDSTWRSWFDFGHRRDGVLEIGADDGPIDYYIIAGPSLADVVRGYAELTGKAPMPPTWALGYQQSRYSYMSDTEVRDLAARLRAEKIPTDVIWLDIDFQDRNRPFTTNPKTFPDLKRLAGDLKGDGFKLVAITDLHIAHAPGQGYAPYDSGTAGDHFLKNPDGSTYVAPVWPGPSVFPDFSRTATRRWWGDLYKGFVSDGIAGFWNDMNEPAIFETPSKTMPLGTRHRIEEPGFAPRTATHAEMHNVYGQLNAQATFDGLKRLRPDERPFVMTRATYAGGQRYAATWTGDNNSTWEHMKLGVQQLLNLGLSGFTWAGTDVGGFTGGASPELLTRWYQIAAFTPVFRNHAGNNAPRSEPWADGPDHLALRKRAIEERYRLLPYLVTLAEQQERAGDPVMRPVFYDYPHMASAPCDQSIAFTFGRDLLVAAAPKPESPQSYEVCLPGEGWYDYWTGARLSGVKIVETPRIDRLPVFVRAGSILPRQPLVQSTSETPRGPLELHVYPGPDCRGELYLDDGRARAKERGQYFRQTFRCTVRPEGVTLDLGPSQGRYRPWWKDVAVMVHGWSGPAIVRSGRKTVQSSTGEQANSISFTLPARPAAITVGRP